MRNSHRYFYPPGFELDPVTITLVKDLVVQVEESSEPMVFTHGSVYHQLIKYVARSKFIEAAGYDFQWPGCRELVGRVGLEPTTKGL